MINNLLDFNVLYGGFATSFMIFYKIRMFFEKFCNDTNNWDGMQGLKIADFTN